jgi:uncharacterized protein (TIGR00369 family)
MIMADELRAALEAVNGASAFNQLAGVQIESVEPGRVAIAIDGAPQLLNHAGALHAGVQSALLDTACGYAAGSMAGNVVTVQLGLQFISSAKGERFIARAEISKAGRSQIFAQASLLAVRDGAEVLVASATAVLAKVGG